MRWPQISRSPRDAALTLGAGIVGAVVGWALNAPVYVLLGPAVAVSLLGVAGMRMVVPPQLRDACFVLLGLAVGAGFDSDALGTMIRWPLAFVVIAVMIWITMVLSQKMLVRGFGFDAPSALMASAPGHLSFVIAMATDSGADVARISVTQSVRLLSLTLVVPFAAMAMGVDVGGTVIPQGAPMIWGSVLVLIVLAVLVGQLFARLSVPAPLLIGAMVVSGAGHISGLTPGVMPTVLILPAYLVLGALIGTRFSGVTLALLASSAGAGLAITGVAVGLSTLAAVPVAAALGMPVAHLLVAFAPGGLETMIAMGVVLGVVPGFVAACHMTRLLVLSVLLPVMLARSMALLQR
ncbi:AbrB family transcriptional regulator [Sulfitobacter sp. SK012]|uniref:AbrB family transcriptional regulator n=1 Tax=Sulfitobacter sp. SK012 TaxID=1389005 RepID=UPI000E0C06D9|nr:AbrB family transcriptional regulator [Sulfitobacter sp. SK012]AXI46229.1 AbrB family transcriptional regulator [Sulfitobacter sp. SK012]